MRSTTALPPPSKLAAIVVPTTSRDALTPAEEVSFRHLRHYLGKHDTFQLAPAGQGVTLPGVRRMDVDPSYFGSALAHNRLMIQPDFYRSFLEYEYVLVYHLDALAFSDRLEEFCALGYDYIGPPWLDHDLPPGQRVGNGGFSLRKVRTLIHFLETYRKYIHISPRLEPKSAIGRFLSHVRIPNINDRLWLAFHGRFNEDMVIGRCGTYYCPEMRIAPEDVALQFAFECEPRACFARNQGQLPFGVHAWERYDRSFWESFLLTTTSICQPREVVLAA